MKINHLFIFSALFFLVLFPLKLSANIARLVIVIDDLGYRTEDTKVYQLPTNINVAIIPSAPKATQLAKLAAKQGRDTLIHMPMQAKSTLKIEPNALTIGFPLKKSQNELSWHNNIFPMLLV